MGRKIYILDLDLPYFANPFTKLGCLQDVRPFNTNIKAATRIIRDHLHYEKAPLSYEENNTQILLIFTSERERAQS